MYVNVPLADQRTQRGADGRPPEDGNEDCVPTSLGAMVTALTGQQVAGDDLHDAVYGQGYVGMQDPSRYVGYLASHYAVQMERVSGTPQALIGRAVAELRAGHPVLLSIPSDWDREPPQSQYAHMVAGCDVDSTHGSAPTQTTLTAMNPWGTSADGYAHAAYQTETLAWWEERLAHCSYQGIWILSREESNVSNVPLGWSDNPAKAVLTATNKQGVVRGFRDWILNHPNWNPNDVPLGAESPDPAISGGVQQVFRYTILRRDAKSGVTEHDRLDVLQQQLAQAAGALSKEQGIADALSKEAADLNTQLSAANAQNAQLKSAVSSLVTVVNNLVTAVSHSFHEAQA